LINISQTGLQCDGLCVKWAIELCLLTDLGIFVKIASFFRVVLNV